MATQSNRNTTAYTNKHTNRSMIITMKNKGHQINIELHLTRL